MHLDYFHISSNPESPVCAAFMAPVCGFPLEHSFPTRDYILKENWASLSKQKSFPNSSLDGVDFMPFSLHAGIWPA